MATLKDFSLEIIKGKGPSLKALLYSLETGLSEYRWVSFFVRVPREDMLYFADKYGTPIKDGEIRLRLRGAVVKMGHLDTNTGKRFFVDCGMTMVGPRNFLIGGLLVEEFHTKDRTGRVKFTA